jgi:hypothetical protein
MLAFALCISLYLFWTLLGLGTLSAFQFGRHSVRNVLLAPTVGAVMTLLPVFWLNRIGFPIRVFGAWLGIALVLLTAMLLWFFRPRVPLRLLAPFAIMLAIAAVLTLWPMFQYGFNWISYGNEDMTNYVLGAERLYYHGYWEKPDLAVYAAGTDPAIGYWFLHVSAGARSGADLLLAWFHAVAGRAMIELFMPLIGAFHLMLLSGVTALAYRFATRRRAAELTMLLFATSALTTMATLSQLIGQVLGLSLLAVGAATFMRPLERLSSMRLIRYGVFGGVLISALVVSYPEILPFLAVPIVIFTVWRMIVGSQRTIILFYATTLATAATLTTTYARYAAGYFAIQVFSGLSAVRPEVLFPYFLIPSGLANVWGLAPINLRFHEPWMSVAIVMGAVLLLLSLLAVVDGLKRFDPTALIVGVMLLLVLRVFSPNTDFALFKLVLYAVPFLVAAASISYVRLAVLRPSRSWIGAFVVLAPILIVTGAGLCSQFVYVERSGGEIGRGGSGLAEVPEASGRGMLRELIEMNRSLPENTRVISDTGSSVIAKIEAGIFRGHPLVFLSNPRIVSYSGGVKGIGLFFHRLRMDPFGADTSAYAERLLAEEAATSRSESFVLPNGRAPDDFLSETGDERILKSTDSVLVTGSLYTVLNRRGNPNGERNSLIRYRGSEVHNQLVFVSSRLGRPASSYIPSEVSLFEPEADVAFSHSTMSALGKFALFEVLQPSDRGYLAVSLTKTYTGDGENRLPDIEVLGADVNRIDFIGRGSAHVILPVRLRQIDGQAYLALDVLSAASRFPDPRSGLMSLYGREIPLDARQVTGFARQISYLSPDEFAALVPPHCISSFPKDLANPALRYSGIYEDGWVAEESYFELTTSESEMLRVSGMVPKLPANQKGNRIRILQDGKPVLEKDLKLGTFDLSAPEASEPGVHEIRILFASATALSELDRRPAAALLSFVGYTNSKGPDHISPLPRLLSQKSVTKSGRDSTKPEGSLNRASSDPSSH